jgi:hypothetical protein
MNLFETFETYKKIMMLPFSSSELSSINRSVGLIQTIHRGKLVYKSTRFHIVSVNHGCGGSTPPAAQRGVFRH